MATVVGILAAGAIAASPWAWGALIVAALIAAILQRRRRRGDTLPVALIFLAAGGLSTSLRPSGATIDFASLPEELTLTGTVVESRERPKSQQIVVSVERVEPHVAAIEGERVFVTIAEYPDSALPPYAGDRVRVTGPLEPLWVIADVKEEIVIGRAQAARGIAAQMRVDNPLQAAVIARARGIMAQAAEVGRDWRHLIDRSQLQPGAKDFLKAVLTGDTDALSPQSRELFSASGLAHLLALSGTHVGIIALIANLALFPLMFWGFRRTQTIVLIILLWAFALVTGMSASVVRATVMTSVFLLARIFQRQSSGLNSLLTAAVIILLASPGQLASIGFQLSFAAVASILIFAPVFNPFWGDPPRRGVIGAIVSFLAVSLAANLGAGVVAAFHFHFFPVMFLLSNAVASLLLPLLLGGGLLLVGAEALSCSCSWLAAGIDICYRLLELTVEAVAALPAASIDGIYFPAWLFIPYAIFLGSLKLAAVSRHRVFRPAYIAAGVAALCTCAGVTAHELTRSYPDEWILTRTPRKSTEIVIRRADQLLLYTSAPPHRHADLLDHLRTRYADYAARRGVSRFAILSPATSDSVVTYVSPGKIIIGLDTLIIASDQGAVAARSRHSQRESLNDFIPGITVISGEEGSLSRCNYFIYGRDCHRQLRPLLYDTQPDTLVRFDSIPPGEHADVAHINVAIHSTASSPWRRPIRRLQQ